MPPIRKLGTVQHQLVETSPFVYRGELLILESVRPLTPDNTHGGLHYLRLRRLADGTRDVRDADEFAACEVLSEFAEGFTFAVPFVRGDELFVYATQGIKEGDTDDVVLFRSDDPDHWEQSLAVQAVGERFYNTSVCSDGERHVMAIETNDSRWPNFTIRFAVSDDLVTWTTLPVEQAIYGTDRYTACPSFRHHDGFYYMWYLERPETWWFETFLTRSRDLLHWEESPANPILRPDPDENINNSDIDFCEFAGNVVIYYSWGSQRGDEHLAHAAHDGTLADWLRECYPE